jgi:hypothetical protein
VRPTFRPTCARGSVAVLAALLLLTPAERARAEDGKPAQIPHLGRWFDHLPERPGPGYEPWTPETVLAFLEKYPGSILTVGSPARVAGYGKHREAAPLVNELQARAESAGVDLSSRVCVSWRFDVLTKHPYASSLCDPLAGGGGCDWEGGMDGSLGEAETVVKTAGQVTESAAGGLIDANASWQGDAWVNRLLVLRPGGADEERRRIVGNGTASLRVDRSFVVPPAAGDAYEVRGSFDPRWVQQVSVSTHRDSVRRFWSESRDFCGRNASTPCRPPAQPLDPLASANTRAWQPWIDRAAFEALRTSSSVPDLYGFAGDEGSDVYAWEDPFFYATAVVMDVGNPAYREWSTRSLLYVLRDLGFEPGEPVCVSFGYKPGMHTFYDEAALGPSSYPCHVAGTNMWAGPAKVCLQATDKSGGAFNPTPFGRGEYERAVNDVARRVLALLTQVGYRTPRIATVERPNFRGEDWTILEPSLREDPRLLGEIDDRLQPRLADLDRPDDPAPEPPQPPPVSHPAEGPVADGEDGDGGSPPPPATPEPTPPAAPDPSPPADPGPTPPADPDPTPPAGPVPTPPAGPVPTPRVAPQPTSDGSGGGGSTTSHGSSSAGDVVNSGGSGGGATHGTSFDPNDD